MGLAKGLYEQVVNVGLQQDFAETDGLLVIDEAMDMASASELPPTVKG